MPWFCVFAVLSAAERAGLDEVVLHHTDPLQEGPQLRAVEQAPRVRLRRLDPIAVLDQAAAGLGLGGELVRIHERVSSPAVRSDLMRAAILYLEGGVYLDVDTVTVNPLLPLLNAQQFIGNELVVWPYFVRGWRTPAPLARSLMLVIVRKALRRLPRGYRMFNRIDGFYHRAVNGAVMGAEARSSFMIEYLRAMTLVPADRQARKCELGPNLLQQLVAHRPRVDLTIHEPQVFYPLPPEISEHWFRIRRRVALEEVLSPDTRVVHWYASVRTSARLAHIDPAYVLKNRHRQLYSALVCSCIRSLPDLS